MFHRRCSRHAPAACAAKDLSTHQHCGSTASSNTTAGPRQRSAHTGEAEQLEAMPLLPPGKRRIFENFSIALVFSRPAKHHFGRDKVCMRQRVACATFAKVAWIDDCYPCFLFQDCPDEAKPREKKRADASDTEASDGSEPEAEEKDSADEEAFDTEQRRRRLLKGENGYYVIDAYEDDDRRCRQTPSFENRSSRIHQICSELRKKCVLSLRKCK